MSKNHSIFFKNGMIQANYFVNVFKNVYKIKYNGEILYNVLMEKHNTMLVNNLICETLHPDNIVAKLYKKLQTLTLKQEKTDMIRKYNDYNYRTLTSGISII